MLQITVPATELWDDKNQVFINLKEKTLQLEHSLVSLSKWESKWCKPFLSKTEKTFEETIDYIKCMTLTPNVDPEVYSRLTNKNVKEIYEYIDSPMTATTIKETQTGPKNREVLTAEVIYCYMVLLGIPFECQKWHLNRLLTLIRVCDIKSKPPKKMGKKDLYRHNSAINAANRKRFHTRG